MVRALNPRLLCLLCTTVDCWLGLDAGDDHDKPHIAAQKQAVKKQTVKEQVDKQSIAGLQDMAGNRGDVSGLVAQL